MLIGCLIMVGALSVVLPLAERIPNDFARLFAGMLTIVGGLWLNYRFQQFFVARIDRDGTQRQAVRQGQAGR